jgi:hypothetical protein
MEKTEQHQAQAMAVDKCAKEGAAEGSPKWAAVVDDRLFPMPRRRLRAEDVLAQAGAGPDLRLVRDLASPVDVAFSPGAIVDLGEGNVFRLVCGCEHREAGTGGAPPKLAFVVDDRWKVSVVPGQTGRSLRGLLGVRDELELLRDFESPDDEAIGETVAVHFADGPVFRTRRRGVTVKVNTRPVHFTRWVVTGLEIKTTAISQGLPIKEDFVLYLKRDGDLKTIGDTDKVRLEECETFTCLAPDDNS